MKKRFEKGFKIHFILLIILMVSGSSLLAEMLFDNFNVYAVQSNPSSQLFFTLAQKSHITKITNYHWNNGRGAEPGYISILDESGGTVYGIWLSHPQKGQGGVPNAYWIVEPDIILESGTYQIVDTDWWTWSCNAASQYIGMTRIEGEKIKQTSSFGSSLSNLFSSKKTNSLKPSFKEQTITLENGVTVTIPENTIRESVTLNMTEPDYEQIERESDDDFFDPDFNFTRIAAYNFTLKGEGGQFIREFDQPIEIEVPYDPDKLNPNYTPGQQIAARRWDEESQRWIYLESEFDTVNQVIRTKTDHFTLIEWVIIVKIVAATEISHRIYEGIVFDQFRTGNFLILYSLKEIQKSSVNNADWVKKGGNSFQNKIIVPKDFDYNYSETSGGTLQLEPLTTAQVSKTPYYIMELGEALDKAYEKYGKHFKKPEVPIIVKVDSKYIKTTGARGAYEKIYRRLHINTGIVNTVDLLKMSSAHELFHVFQNEYYSKTQMSQATGKAYHWWLEATADWAACNIAWPELEMMGAQASSQKYPYIKEMEYSLNYIGSPDGLVDDIEYDRAFFVDYLVNQGADFPELFKYVAKNSDMTYPVFSPLIDYFKINRTYNDEYFDALYRNFAALFFLSDKSPVNPKTDRLKAAVKNDAFSKSSGTILNGVFNLKGGFTTNLWMIAVTGSEKIRMTAHTLSKSGDYMTADIYVMKKGEKERDFYSKKVGELTKFFTDADFEAAPGDVIYIVMCNTSPEVNGNISIKLQASDISLSITPSEIDNKDGKLDHNFEIKAENIPSSHSQLRFVWYTSDDRSSKQNIDKTPSGMTSSFSIRKTFPSDGDYTLYVKLYDPDDLNRVLAEKECRIKIETMGQGFDCNVDLSTLKKEIERKKIYYLDNSWDMQGPYEAYFDEAKTKLYEKGCMKDDYPVGHWIRMHENGQKFYDGYYNDRHARDIHWDFWYEDGTPQSSCDYSDGKLHGNCIWYHQNGTPEIQGRMVQGEKEGLWKEWYENGNLSFEGSYKAGYFHGSFRSYSETGLLKETGSYDMNEPNGFWNLYDSKGVRYQSLDYDNAVTIIYKKDGQEVERVENW